MSDIAIRAKNLGKRYRLGQREPYKTLRDVMTDAFAAPFRRWRKQNLPISQSPFRDPKPDHIWALKDVSFEIKQGEVVGIIGRNGTGKTTLLKVLSRTTEPTEGYAEVYGRVGSLLEVGTGFSPELTGRENIYLNAAILGMKKREIDQKFDEIVAFAEVEKFLDTPVKRYSSGMFVRLAFAVAAHLEPEILLVDEVLAVGDAAFQKKCLGKMGEVAKEGRTVIFVSHNMSAIINLCSRAFLQKHGRLEADGSADKIVRLYLRSLESIRSGDLVSVENRQGRGVVRFSCVWFENERGHTIEQAMSGETVVIALHYQSQVDNDLPNCRVSIAVEDIFGQALFVCSTEMISNEPRYLPPEGTARCVIPRFPLCQGQYNLTLFFEVNHEIEDWLPSVASLNVIDGDFFGSGRQYPDGWQGKGVLVNHQWKITRD